MVSKKGRRRALAAAGVLGLAGGGAAVAGVASSEPNARPAQSMNGLKVKNPAVTGLVVEREAVAGATDRREIENGSKETLEITVKARPWTQSSTGDVSPNRRKELSQVQISDTSFTLAPGESKAIDVKLRSSTVTYGALEIIGLPANIDERKGVVAGYRLVNALRYNPATPKYRLKTGAVKLSGSGKARKVVLTVRNSGNTVAPVSGRVSLKGALGTRNGSVKSVRILPRKTLKLPLWSVSKLKEGTYTATIRLTHGGKTTKITKKVKVKR